MIRLLLVVLFMFPDFAEAKKYQNFDVSQMMNECLSPNFKNTKALKLEVENFLFRCSYSDPYKVFQVKVSFYFALGSKSDFWYDRYGSLKKIRFDYKLNLSSVYFTIDVVGDMVSNWNLDTNVVQDLSAYNRMAKETYGSDFAAWTLQNIESIAGRKIQGYNASSHLTTVRISYDGQVNRLLAKVQKTTNKTEQELLIFPDPRYKTLVLKDQSTNEYKFHDSEIYKVVGNRPGKSVTLTNLFPVTIGIEVNDKAHIEILEALGLFDNNKREQNYQRSLMSQFLDDSYQLIEQFRSSIQFSYQQTYSTVFSQCEEARANIRHPIRPSLMDQEERNSYRDLTNCIEILEPLLNLHKDSYLNWEVSEIFAVKEFIKESLGWHQLDQGLPSLQIANLLDQLLTRLNFLIESFENRIPSEFKKNGGEELEKEVIAQLHELVSYQAELAGDLSLGMGQELSNLSSLWNNETFQRHLLRFQAFARKLENESKSAEAEMIHHYWEKIREGIENLNSNLNQRNQFLIPSEKTKE